MIKGETKAATASKEEERARKKFLALMEALPARRGPWLRGWRDSHAITQTELAALLGVSFATVLRMEKDDRVVPKVWVLALEGR